MTNSTGVEGSNKADFPDFENDLDLLIEDVTRGFRPESARAILRELVSLHQVPQMLAKFATGELEHEIMEVNKLCWKKKGPNPDPMLDPSLHDEFEKRVRKRFGLT